MVDFLFALMELFRYLLRFRSYEAKCVRLGCFHRGSTSLHSNFTWIGSSPSTILGVRKLETLGYPVVKTTSFSVPSLTQYRSVTDRRTDRRICCRIYSRLQRLAKLVLRLAVKRINRISKPTLFLPPWPATPASVTRAIA